MFVSKFELFHRSYVRSPNAHSPFVLYIAFLPIEVAFFEIFTCSSERKRTKGISIARAFQRLI